MASRNYSFDFAEKKNSLQWKLENQHGFESSHHRRNKYKMQKFKKKKTGFKKISSKEKNYKQGHYAHVTDEQPQFEEAIASGFATGT